MVDSSTQIFNASQNRFIETVDASAFNHDLRVPKQWHGGVNCNQGFYYIEMGGLTIKVGVIDAILYFVARDLGLAVSCKDDLDIVAKLLARYTFYYELEGDYDDGVPAKLRVLYNLKCEQES